LHVRILPAWIARSTSAGEPGELSGPLGSWAGELPNGKPDRPLALAPPSRQSSGLEPIEHPSLRNAEQMGGFLRGDASAFFKPRRFHLEVQVAIKTGVVRTPRLFGCCAIIKAWYVGVDT
jgi:hypothetical protein